MKIGKFNNFVNKRRVNENQTELMPEPEEMSDELMMSGTTKPTIAPPVLPKPPVKPEETTIKPSVIPTPRKANVQMTEEEESDSQIDTDLNELATELGAEKVGNVINYDGMKIEFYSEPMLFAIDGKTKLNVGGRKKELKTIQDVIDYVNSTETGTQVPGRAPQPSGPGQQRPVTQMQAQVGTQTVRENRHRFNIGASGYPEATDTTIRLDQLTNLQKIKKLEEEIRAIIGGNYEMSEEYLYKLREIKNHLITKH